ncbi:hypothetical protein I3760_05G022800 [Carya illinoinensis]|nr:hypothetical protein I3760_13G065800 [Carya illinoinensis]KAG2704811.1 hypothetical protein I3760_05G022800 [Carya illinoinensis]
MDKSWMRINDRFSASSALIYFGEIDGESTMTEHSATSRQIFVASCRLLNLRF